MPLEIPVDKERVKRKKAGEGGDSDDSSEADGERTERRDRRYAAISEFHYLTPPHTPRITLSFHDRFASLTMLCGSR